MCLVFDWRFVGGLTKFSWFSLAYTMTATKRVHDGHKVDYDDQSMTAMNYGGHFS